LLKYIGSKGCCDNYFGIDRFESDREKVLTPGCEHQMILSAIEQIETIFLPRSKSQNPAKVNSKTIWMGVPCVEPR
jgi:hypothetical protein